jgi:glycosyltransferase involved in cell wall biosynthesis
MTSATAADPATSPVLFLTHSFPRQAGDAAGSFILRLARALEDRGTRVLVVTPHARGLSTQDEIAGIQVMRYRYAPQFMETLAYTGTMAEQVRASWVARAALLSLFASGFWRALLARRRWRPRLIHAHWWFPSGIMAAALARVAGVPLVTTMHGSDVRLARKSPASHPAFRWVLSSSKRSTAVSRWLADEAHEMAPALPPPIVAPMPAATDLFFPSGERENARVLFVGRLNEQKGLELLLRGLALMRRPAALDVVGAGEQEAALRALAGSLGIASRVTWHGALPQERLASFYRRAAALIVPSREEGLGLVAVEAQLCETPVVAFDSGGLRDIVEHQRTGILVTHQTPGALAAAIDDVLENRDHALELGREARRVALETFAPASAARRYAEIYENAIGADAASNTAGSSS